MSRARSAAGMVLLVMAVSVGCEGLAATTHPRSRVRYVDILDRPGFRFAFSPRTISVRVGTRVVWRNRSSQSHTVTATGAHRAFDSGSARFITSGHQWSFVFRRPGRYAYYCRLHPFMMGTVMVRR